MEQAPGCPGDLPIDNHASWVLDVPGVPYAEPPVGSLRFSPPRSPEPWRGVRQSLDFAPVCPQVGAKTTGRGEASSLRVPGEAVAVSEEPERGLSLLERLRAAPARR